MWDFEEVTVALTALKVKHAGPGKHADLHGLCLVVRDTETRAWVLRMQHLGRRRDFRLGAVHDFSLADARVKAADLRKAVRAGIDPTAGKQAARKVVPTFEKVVRECYSAMKGG